MARLDRYILDWIECRPAALEQIATIMAPTDAARDEVAAALGLGKGAFLAAAHVGLLFGSIAASLPHVKTGRLKAFATTGVRRSKVVPELPTMIEQGFPGFDVQSWYAFLTPAGTPAIVVRRLRDESLKVIAMPEVQQSLSRQGLEPETSTPQELAARIKSETTTWAQVIKEAGIKGE